MPEYTLYSFWRSSCSARLRIALNLKGIIYETISVDLLQHEQTTASYKNINPSGSVPLLLRNDPKSPIKIGQSMAALEYLEEAHPEYSLLPPTSDIRGRAIVRTLANIIACDTQPVTNLRIMKRVRALGGDAEQWNHELMVSSLTAYEATAAPHAGRFSYGDSVTVADVCLLPAVWNAKRFGVDLTPFPTIVKIAEALEQLKAVRDVIYI